jgi:hypothetical protein
MLIRSLATGAIGTVLLALLPLPAQADDGRVGRSTHPWAQFGSGSFSLLKRTSETTDEKGRRETTVTHTRTTLLAIDEETYTLKIETIVDAGGKQIVGDPKIVRRTFDDLPAEATPTVKDVPDENSVVVEKKKLPCRVYEVSFNNEVHRTTTKTYYNSAIAPHVLQRKTSTIDAQSGNEQRYVEQKVIAFDMPCRVGNEMKSGAHVQIEETHSGGTVMTIVVLCRDVPGGVVSQTSREMDTRGNVIRRSTLELVDFGVKEEPRQATMNTGYRRRWLARRARRAIDSETREAEAAAALPVAAVDSTPASRQTDAVQGANDVYSGRRGTRRYQVCSSSR